jgi:iron complex outermembrane receptor protein
LYTGGHQEFSPSVSGAYWVNSRVKLRASASHAFRLPDYTELYYSDPRHLGNPNLRPESSWSFEGGTQVVLGRDVTLNGDVFHHRDHDVIDYARLISAGPNAKYVAQNVHQLNFTGAEVSLRWQLPRQQRIEVSYTGIHVAGTALPGVQYLYVFNYPVNEGVVTWWGRLPGGLDSRFRVAAIERFQSAQPSAQPPQGPYPLVECTVGRQFRYLKPYVQLTNLANTKYQEIAGVVMPGRGFIAGLEVQWKEK